MPKQVPRNTEMDGGGTFTVPEFRVRCV